MWQATADEESFERDTDAYDWVDANLEADLGGRVYGLNSVFCSVDDGDRTPADVDPASLWADRRAPPGTLPAFGAARPRRSRLALHPADPTLPGGTP